jgi:ferredoxin
MTARAAVDAACCEGHALCLGEAPEVFDMGPGERAYVLDIEITDELLPAVERAALSCPTQAIRIERAP